MRQFNRRALLRSGIQVVTMATLVPLSMRRAVAASCSDPASESLRTSLNYTEASPSATQTCSACAFFTAVADCGNCSIMSDKVNPKGHCDSWAARS